MAEIETFQPVENVGAAIENFASLGLLDLLTKVVCDPCEEPVDGCSGCYGMVALSHIENQIEEAGIEFMKKLLQEWQSE